MAETANKLVTLEEFLTFDDGTDRRYELHDGEIVAMAPVSDRHSRLSGRMAVMIGAHLRPPCDVYPEAGVRPANRANTYYHADVAVSCSETTGGPFVSEPLVIVEVLSPSTTAVDRGRKLRDYREIPSVQDILLVSSAERRVEHWRRNGEWSSKVHHDNGGQLRLQAFPIEIDVERLYADVLPE